MHKCVTEIPSKKKPRSFHFDSMYVRDMKCSLWTVVAKQADVKDAALVTLIEILVGTPNTASPQRSGQLAFRGDEHISAHSLARGQMATWPT